LFGKPFRRVNKPQLINSVNKKDLYTEVSFSVGPNKYIVQRGIKPNLFEIFVNGERLQQDAAVKDYQKYLEQNILRMTFRSFTQIVILGSATFVPFMQLAPAARREVVENLLDIQSFSTMFTLVKDRIRSIRDQIKDLERDERILRERVTMQEKHIKSLHEQSDERINDLKKQIDKLTVDVSVLFSQEENLITNIRELSTINDELLSTDPSNKWRKLQSFGGKIENKIDRIRQEILFYSENDVCQSCHQKIDPEFKKDRLEHNHKEEHTLLDGLDQLQKQSKELMEIIVKIDENKHDINQLTNELTRVRTKKTSDEKSIERLRNEIEQLTNSEKNISREEGKLEVILEDLNKHSEKYENTTTGLSEHEVVYNLLKDSGVKTSIIRQYLPIMNRLVSNYLKDFDFPINFTLDEEFNETIESPVHRNFSYSSFSEGEKTRIDLSILFAMREIARLKQSIDTNILFFDEIFDSSLDVAGTEEFLRILRYILQDTNIFVISHKISDGLGDRFDRTIEFQKVRGFSTIV
jgi:DNA repair exonuclease SbcCD ATPase subunit